MLYDFFNEVKKELLCPFMPFMVQKKYVAEGGKNALRFYFYEVKIKRTYMSFMPYMV